MLGCTANGRTHGTLFRPILLQMANPGTFELQQNGRRTLLAQQTTAAWHGNQPSGLHHRSRLSALEVLAVLFISRRPHEPVAVVAFRGNPSFPNWHHAPHADPTMRCDGRDATTHHRLQISELGNWRSYMLSPPLLRSTLPVLPLCSNMLLPLGAGGQDRPKGGGGGATRNLTRCSSKRVRGEAEVVVAMARTISKSAFLHQGRGQRVRARARVDKST